MSVWWGGLSVWKTAPSQAVHNGKIMGSGLAYLYYTKMPAPLEGEKHIWTPRWGEVKGVKGKLVGLFI
jgi:hypothetical protein